jgi:hypothetical protein
MRVEAQVRPHEIRWIGDIRRHVEAGKPAGSCHVNRKEAHGH